MSVRGQRLISGIIQDDEVLHAEKCDSLLNPLEGNSIMAPRNRRPTQQQQQQLYDQPDIYGQVHPRESPALVEEKLWEFDAEVGNLPKEKRISLTLAQERCPQLLTNTFKLQFLRCEVFRVKVRDEDYSFGEPSNMTGPG